MKKNIALAFIACMLAIVQAYAAMGLTVRTEGSNQVSITQDANTGVYTIQTTGGDPYFMLSPLTADLSEDADTLSFEYKASADMGDLQIFFCDPTAETRSQWVRGILKQTDEWTKVEINIAQSRSSFNWGYVNNYLRLDPGSQAGITLQLRRISIDGSTIGGESITLSDAEKNAIATHLQRYLNTNYKSSVTAVDVQDRSVTITGKCENAAGHKYALVEVTPYMDITEISKFADGFRTSIDTPEEFTITLNRRLTRDGGEYDRLLSKWAIVDCTDSSKDVLASHAHFADEVKAISSPAETMLKSKKGLGGFIMGGPNTDDIQKLGITSVTVNVILNAIGSLTNNGGIAHSYGGKIYYMNESQVDYFDRVFKYCQDRGIVTSAILLCVPSGGDTRFTSRLRNPEYTSGPYTMPNFHDAAGVEAYAAIIDFLAKRYNGRTYGRINHWIMHNEVDQGSYWTNMGKQPMMRYLETYMRSMRLVYNIARQYDQNTFVLGSYTHSWNNADAGGDYAVRTLLSSVNRFSNAEGDFQWGVAYHPYPENLTRPQFWKDDVHATYSLTSSYVTFKNLEVVSDWMLDRSHYYKGAKKRILFLSEQGTNSPSYSATDLRLQAAGACWAWKKVHQLTGIDAMQWHNWTDNRAEGGLRIGLRRYADDETDPNGAKPVWYVWQAAGTDNEDAVFQPYLATIGISSWDEIFHKVPGGVESVTSKAQELDVYGKAGAIVANTAQPASVYTLTGSLVARANGEISVAPGIYIVKCAGMSKKVIVR